jgi:hypothetical protein
MKLSVTFQELFHFRNCVCGGKKLILWNNIEEVEIFVSGEVFSLTDEDKRGWIIVVDNSQFEGHPQ